MDTLLAILATWVDYQHGVRAWLDGTTELINNALAKGDPKIYQTAEKRAIQRTMIFGLENDIPRVI